MSNKKTEDTPPNEAGANGASPETEASDATTPEPNDTAESGWSKGEAEALREENAQLKDRLLRAAAEMENLRRRTERDKSDTAKFAISNFARDVLTIADNIARAIEHVPEEAAEADEALKSFLEGMQVTERELLNVLERHGITRVDPKGERFDPNKHQAMFEVENTGVPEGTVVEVVQQGYSIAERVLRPALVGVAKGGPKPAKADKEKTEGAPPEPANDDTPKAEAADEPAESEKPKPKSKENVGANVDKSA
ncbi:MAG: nucleotide exchange factor GrpE [Hyphomicrobiaceae bacterium]|nr:nucleotide exchange factor GrpE [Hyphomicrobiaceae bacterium]